MSKPVAKPNASPASPIKPPQQSFTGKAYIAYKVDDLLCESAELTLEDGIVVDTKVLTRGADLPSVAISKCQTGLWKTYKLQRGVAQ